VELRRRGSYARDVTERTIPDLISAAAGAIGYDAAAARCGFEHARRRNFGMQIIARRNDDGGGGGGGGGGVVVARSKVITVFPPNIAARS